MSSLILLETGGLTVSLLETGLVVVGGGTEEGRGVAGVTIAKFHIDSMFI
jgi:hypothetical protein